MNTYGHSAVSSSAVITRWSISRALVNQPALGNRDMIALAAVDLADMSSKDHPSL